MEKIFDQRKTIMKKKVLLMVVSVALAAVFLLGLLPGCSENPDPTPPIHGNHTTNPTTSSTEPPEDRGMVRLYSCNSRWLAALEPVAAQYTQQTGIPVELLGAQDDGCQQTLARLLEGENAPTVLCVHSQSQLLELEKSLLPLQNTAFGAALCAKSFGLYASGNLMAVPMGMEGFGLLVNAEVLATKGALSRNDITDMQSLATAVQILKDNSVKAFPSTPLDILSALYLLQSNQPDKIRTFLDLYLNNCLKSGDAQTQFQNGECAFYLGGTWDYAVLTSQDDQKLQVRNLDILPTYAAGGIQYIFSAAWAVNGNARQLDADATLEFLAWLVTAGEDGATPVDALQVITPFADAGWYGNQLEKKLLGYRTSEVATLCWMPGSGDYTKLLTALQAYMDSRTDENWAFLMNILSKT